MLIINPPDDLSFLGNIPVGIDVSFTEENVYNVILLFIKNSAELHKEVANIEHKSDAGTILWAIYPKKASGIATDLNSMIPWTALANYGLEVVSAAGINVAWTALRIRPLGQAKPSGMCLNDIANNDYGRYIDVKNRTVSMPNDLKTAVTAHPEAINQFDRLSFSNKKEYVLWVLTAKQEKTRATRIAQSVVKLGAGKKNPSAK